MRLLSGSTIALLLFAAVEGQILKPKVPDHVVQEHGQRVLNDAESHSSCERACAAIAQILPGAFYLQTEGDFPDHFWDIKQRELVPACRIEPSTPEEVSEIVLILTQEQCPFAIRSGGHSRIPGSSNVQDGVTIDLARMNSVEVAADKQSVRIGAGAQWLDVYIELEKHNIMVPGGRVSDVGVGGLTMGGGLSFFGNTRGWPADNVLDFHIVFGNGSLGHINEDSDKELYWALRGGGNNFGIVTSFDFETFPRERPELWRAQLAYSYDQMDALLDAQHDFVTKQQVIDPEAASYFAWGWNQMYNQTVIAILCVHGSHSDSDTFPAAFSRFEDIPRIPDASIQGLRKLSDITLDQRQHTGHGVRAVYKTVTYEANREMQKRIMHHFIETFQPLTHLNMSSFVPFLIFHPVAPGQTAAMTKRGGNPLGIADSGPLMITQTSWTWKDAKDDEINIKANEQLFEQIEADGKKLGVLKDFIYQNYAWSDQKVFEGYGKENLGKLKKIQKRVDPDGVFARGGLCGGYFKINDKEGGEGSFRDEL